MWNTKWFLQAVIPKQLAGNRAFINSILFVRQCINGSAGRGLLVTCSPLHGYENPQGHKCTDYYHHSVTLQTAHQCTWHNLRKLKTGCKHCLQQTDVEQSISRDGQELVQTTIDVLLKNHWAWPTPACPNACRKLAVSVLLGLSDSVKTIVVDIVLRQHAEDLSFVRNEHEGINREVPFPSWHLKRAAPLATTLNGMHRSSSSSCGLHQGTGRAQVALRHCPAFY